VQCFAEASQKFTVPSVTAVLPAFTVAVSVTTVFDSTEVTALPPLVTALPPLVTASVVVVAAAAAQARLPPANARRNSAKPTVNLPLLTTLGANQPMIMMENKAKSETYATSGKRREKGERQMRTRPAMDTDAQVATAADTILPCTFIVVP
jgi:hypothetical protein